MEIKVRHPPEKPDDELRSYIYSEGVWIIYRGVWKRLFERETEAVELVIRGLLPILQQNEESVRVIVYD